MVKRAFWASLAFSSIMFASGSVTAEESAPIANPAQAHFSVESTPIGEILDFPAAKAILDKHIPGLSANPQIDMARSMTLRQANGYAPDQVPEEALKKIEADFAALNGS